MVMVPTKPSPGFWSGKRVLLTGHTGFKGSWLTLWLRQLGAEVTGLSLPVELDPSLFNLASVHTLCKSCYCDIRDSKSLTEVVRDINPEIIFHLAAQSLVRTSYREPLLTYETNVLGTANLLNALRFCDDARVAVMVTTDKVYKNLEQKRPFLESDPLGGHDPYSASKAASEIVIASYRDAYLAESGVSVASARAGNVIGGGDWSKDRLIPDIIRAWSKGTTLKVRHPYAVRPWQHVLEALNGYLRLAESLWEDPNLAGDYNFGPSSSNVASVQEIIELARSTYGYGEVLWEVVKEGPHEAGWLSLATIKSSNILGVNPRWDLFQTVSRTINWYRFQSLNEDASALCANDISSYQS